MSNLLDVDVYTTAHTDTIKVQVSALTLLSYGKPNGKTGRLKLKSAVEFDCDPGTICYIDTVRYALGEVSVSNPVVHSKLIPSCAEVDFGNGVPVMLSEDFVVELPESEVILKAGTVIRQLNSNDAVVSVSTLRFNTKALIKKLHRYDPAVHVLTHAGSKLLIRSMSTHQLLDEITMPAKIWQLRLSVDIAVVVSEDTDLNTIYIVRLSDMQIKSSICVRASDRHVCISSDGLYIITAGHNITFYSVATGRKQKVIKRPTLRSAISLSYSEYICISSNDAYVAVLHYTYAEPNVIHSNIDIYNVATMRRVNAVTNIHKRITAMAFVPHTYKLILGYVDGSVATINIIKPEVSTSIKILDERITCIHWAADNLIFHGPEGIRGSCDSKSAGPRKFSVKNRKA